MSIASEYNFNPVPDVARRKPDFGLVTGNVRQQIANRILYNFDSPVQAAFYENKVVETAITLIAPSYEVETPDPQVKGRYIKSTIPSSRIMLKTVLVDVSQMSVVTKTQIVGRNGTVKEYIGLDDFKINIRGALVNHVEDKMPVEEQKLLTKILSAPVALEVISDYLQTVYNINNVVVEDKRFPQEEGISNTQYFDISFISDEAIELNSPRIK